VAQLYPGHWVPFLSPPGLCLVYVITGGPEGKHLSYCWQSVSVPTNRKYVVLLLPHYQSNLHRNALGGGGFVDDLLPSNTCLFFFMIPFYLQSVLVHSANCVKDMAWHVEECSVALLCN
jgi:hypothetical protein